MIDKNMALNEIIDYYLNSKDFNGLELYRMKNYDYDILCNLIDENLIEVLSTNEVINPHIKGFNLNIPKETQKSNIFSKDNHSILYPTPNALEHIQIKYESPYTDLMHRGKGQFEIIFFDIDILERYINNPKFIVMDNGYRGTIYLRDEFYDNEDIQDEYIKDYGMAYKDEKRINRAIGVFITDLANLSPQKQMLWKGFELLNQSEYKINHGFIDNLLLGQWVEEVWIFHALIDEMKVINKQCELMGIPKLFNKTFGTDYTEMPEGYRNIFLPTLKNYYDFVLVLEKMVVHNISYKTFQKSAYPIESIERKDENGKDKGSLVMFDEWLNKNIQTQEDLSQIIIKPLRNIRKIRQKPAHELTSNRYDINLYKEQNDLMNDTYTAVRAIRLFFCNHPLVRNNIKIPEYLITGEKIVSY